MITLSQTIALTFTTGLLFGLYFITVCLANRWLLFADEGWRWRKRVHWSMVFTTNVIAALILASTILSVRVPMAEMDFVEDGHKPEEWTDPAWDSIAKVSFCESPLMPRIQLFWLCEQCMIADTVALLADIVLVSSPLVTF